MTTRKPEDTDPGEITTSADLGFTPREIEVDRIEEVKTPQRTDPNALVEIRMNETLEDFTYGNPHVHHKLERGKRYRMPAHIAQYLDGLGYVWH